MSYITQNIIVSAKIMEGKPLVLAGRCEKRLYNSDLYSRRHRPNFEYN